MNWTKTSTNPQDRLQQIRHWYSGKLLLDQHLTEFQKTRGTKSEELETFMLLKPIDGKPGDKIATVRKMLADLEQFERIQEDLLETQKKTVDYLRQLSCWGKDEDAGKLSERVFHICRIMDGADFELRETERLLMERDLQLTDLLVEKAVIRKDASVSAELLEDGEIQEGSSKKRMSSTSSISSAEAESPVKKGARPRGTLEKDNNRHRDNVRNRTVSRSSYFGRNQPRRGSTPQSPLENKSDGGRNRVLESSSSSSSSRSDSGKLMKTSPDHGPWPTCHTGEKLS